MFSYAQLAIARAVTKSLELGKAGDREGARDRMLAAVRRHPQILQGWIWASTFADRAGSTLEERLDLFREASKHLPYDPMVNDHLATLLMETGVLIGNRSYLEEAEETVGRLEAILGRCAETISCRMLLAQLSGACDDDLLEWCKEVEAALTRDPQPRLRMRLALVLMEIDGHKARGLEMARGAATKLKNPVDYVHLSVLVEGSNKMLSNYFSAQAQDAGRCRLTHAQIETMKEGVRHRLRAQEEFLAAV